MSAIAATGGGACLAACGSGEFPGLDEDGADDAGGDASLDGNAAPADAADSSAADVVAVTVDAGCAAQFSGTVSAVSGQQYGSCAACVESACMAVLAVCFDDCNCGDDVVSLFGCLQTGGSLGACGVAVTADFSASAESLALEFVTCAATCSGSCSSADAGRGGDSGARMDAGDSGTRGSP